MVAINRLGPIYDPLRDRGIPTLPFIYIGLVKANDDGQRMGRLSVWIPEIGGDPADEASWIVASYATPFAGSTDITQINGYTTNSTVAQQSYGLWMVPPDLNNEVAVFFANGDVSRAYWFACTVQQYMNKMIPGIPSDVTTEPSPPIHVSPVIEYNKADKNNDVYNPRRPPFLPLTNGLNTEGLDKDLERGPSSTSARREAPSQVYGLLSPRGNNIHIDDNTANEFIRLRTRSGAQVLIHETTGYVYINSKNGNAWVEISDAGVDVYSANSVSIRAQGDVNVRADRNIFLDADQDISMRAGQNITMEAAAGNMQVKVAQNLNLSVDANMQMTVKTDCTLNAGNDIQAGAKHNLVLSAGNDGTINLGNDFNVVSGETIRLESTTDTHINSQSRLRLVSTGDTSLKAGGKQLRDGTAILDNSGQAPGVERAEARDATVPTAPVVPAGAVQLDTTPKLYGGTTLDGTGQWLWNASGATVNTIASSMPCHEPWRYHPRSNVPDIPLENVPVNYEPTYGGATDPNGALQTDSSGAVAGTQVNDSGCSFGAANTKPCSTEVFNAIKAAADKTGADQATMLAFADMESSFQPNAKSKSSSATGLFQFTSSTWDSMVKQYGAKYNVSADGITDAPSNALMGGQFIQDNANRLKTAGLPVNPGNLYIMHFMGSGGGPPFIKAALTNSSANAASLFPAAASANSTIFGNNRSVGEVYQNLTNNANSKANAYAGQIGSQAPCIRAEGTNVAAPPGSSTPSSSGNTLLPSNFEQYKGQSIGDGECVAFVRQACNLPQAVKWKPGDAPTASTPIGTPLASFQNGHYVGHTGLFDGMFPDGSGFYMIDQYNNPKKTPVGVRTYSYNRTGIQNANIYRIVQL